MRSWHLTPPSKPQQPQPGYPGCPCAQRCQSRLVAFVSFLGLPRAFAPWYCLFTLRRCFSARAALNLSRVCATLPRPAWSRAVGCVAATFSRRGHRSASAPRRPAAAPCHSALQVPHEIALRRCARFLPAAALLEGLHNACHCFRRAAPCRAAARTVAANGSQCLWRECLAAPRLAPQRLVFVPAREPDQVSLRFLPPPLRPCDVFCPATRVLLLQAYWTVEVPSVVSRRPLSVPAAHCQVRACLLRHATKLACESSLSASLSGGTCSLAGPGLHLLPGVGSLHPRTSRPSSHRAGSPVRRPRGPPVGLGGCPKLPLPFAHVSVRGTSGPGAGPPPLGFARHRRAAQRIVATATGSDPEVIR